MRKFLLLWGLVASGLWTGTTSSHAAIVPESITLSTIYAIDKSGLTKVVIKSSGPRHSIGQVFVEPLSYQPQFNLTIPSSIPAGGQEILQILFTPNIGGQHTGVLVIEIDGAPVRVPFSGRKLESCDPANPISCIPKLGQCVADARTMDGYVIEIPISPSLCGPVCSGVRKNILLQHSKQASNQDDYTLPYAQLYRPLVEAQVVPDPGPCCTGCPGDCVTDVCQLGGCFPDLNIDRPNARSSWGIAELTRGHAVTASGFPAPYEKFTLQLHFQRGFSAFNVVGAMSEEFVGLSMEYPPAEYKLSDGPNVVQRGRIACIHSSVDEYSIIDSDGRTIILREVP